jgi:hypothetical protein
MSIEGRLVFKSFLSSRPLKDICPAWRIQQMDVVGHQHIGML